MRKKKIEGKPQSKRRKRTFKQWCQDVWFAMRGTTFVCVKAYCYACDEDITLEFHQDVSQSFSSSNVGVGRMGINTVWYYPSLRTRHELLNGNNYVLYKKMNPKYPQRMKRPHWNKECNWDKENLRKELKGQRARRKEKRLERAKELIAKETLKNTFKQESVDE